MWVYFEYVPAESVMRTWERREEARRLRSEGKTWKAVGAAIGVTDSRAAAMVGELERREKLYGPPEAPWWIGLRPRTANALMACGIYSRDDCMCLAGDLIMYWGSVVLPGWEKDRGRDWRHSTKKIKLAVVNDVRAWLGVAPFVPPSRGPR